MSSAWTFPNVQAWHVYVWLYGRRAGATVCGLRLEAGIKVDFQRVCSEVVVPFARHLEDQVLPNVARITQAAMRLCKGNV